MGRAISLPETPLPRYSMLIARLRFIVSKYQARLVLPGCALLLMLQRSPVLTLVREFYVSWAPRNAHIFKWAVGTALLSGVYNTVTAATGELFFEPGFNNLNGRVGESMNLAIKAEKAVPVTVQLEGDLPEGLNSNIGEGGAVPNGTIAFSGAPTETGAFPMKLSVLTWATDDYEGDPIFIDFTIRVELEGPEITTLPESIVIPWGATAELSVEVANEEGVTYQWQRNVGASLDLFADLEGETAAVYSVPNATPALDGAYRVQVTKNDITVISDAVFVSVREADFASWQFREFGENRNAPEAEADANPDLDAFINAFEFLFDLNPQVADSIQAPTVSQEIINEEAYAVFRFPGLIDYPELDYAFESTGDLAGGSWSELVDGIDGVMIEITEMTTILKIPAGSAIFCRVRVNTGD